VWAENVVQSRSDRLGQPRPKGAAGLLVNTFAKCPLLLEIVVGCALVAGTKCFVPVDTSHRVFGQKLGTGYIFRESFDSTNKVKFCRWDGPPWNAVPRYLTCDVKDFVPPPPWWPPDVRSPVYQVLYVELPGFGRKE